MPAFLLPDLGEGLTEAEIVAWHVQTGDTVTVDQPIVEVETAKAAVEVPVPFAGLITARYGQPGDGSVAPPAPNGRLPVASPLIRQLARGAGVDLTTIRGSGRGGLITRADVDAAINARQAGPTPVPEPAPAVPPADGVIRIPIRG